MPRKKSGGIERREVDGTGSSGWVSFTGVNPKMRFFPQIHGV